MNKLNLGITLAVCGLIVFLSSGSLSDGSLINGAIRSLWEENNPYRLVAGVGFGMMIVGTLLLIAWILFPGKQQQKKIRHKMK